MAANIPLENLFQTMAVRLNAERVEGVVLTINVEFSDTEPVVLSIENSVLHARPGRRHDDADATIQTDSVSFKLLMAGATTAPELIAESKLRIDGNVMALAQLGGYFDRFERRYPLVTPRRDWRATE